ncbi:MAG: hypothetical protein CMG09_05060 [Candidatus Marinimicrobia bacterium]|nr:hypothetical protein [Candidatus Neomarinimicrobiota bacterium]|tara:strand:+ start:11443 stop:12426 length:984 start_codon:yes stop_codon:yes gene_type:complete
MKLYNFLKSIYIYFFGSIAFYNAHKMSCKNIVFYNNYHNGDIHYSREFIKHIINCLPNKTYYYIHHNSKRILLDIESLTFKIPDLIIKKWKKNKLDTYKMDINTNLLRSKDTLFINTWIGSNKGQYLQLYNGCTIQANYYLFKKILSELGISNMDGIAKYIPILNFNKYEVGRVDNFMSSNKQMKIFISNGDCLSNQAENFDMSPIINKLCNNYNKCLFLISNKNENLNSNLKNLVYTSDIIAISDNDLPENSYISTFCDIIIGRGSGAYCFTTIQDNWNSKKIICFSKNKEEGLWAENSSAIHSNSSDSKIVYEIISKEISNLEGI